MLPSVNDAHHAGSCVRNTETRGYVPWRLKVGCSELTGALEDYVWLQDLHKQAVSDNEGFHTKNRIANVPETVVGGVGQRVSQALASLPQRVVHVLTDDARNLNGGNGASVHQLYEVGHGVDIGHYGPGPYIFVNTRSSKAGHCRSTADGDDFQRKSGARLSEVETPPSTDSAAELNVPLWQRAIHFRALDRSGSGLA